MPKDDQHSGSVLIYYGGSPIDDSPDLRIVGFGSTSRFRSAVAPAGDFSRDGFPDVVIGAPCASESDALAVGAAYVCFGGPTIDATPDWAVWGEASFRGLGASVAGIGDFSGDGHDDILVGEPLRGLEPGFGGRAYIFMKPTATERLTLGIPRDEPNARFGLAVAGVGDFNDDGWPDVAVGAPLKDTHQGFNCGAVYIFFGGSTDTRHDLVLEGEHAGDCFGYSVSGAGDFNGDGCDDIVVGAPLHDQVEGCCPITPGAAYVFFGGSKPNAVADVKLTPAAMASSFAEFGWTVASAGDVGGDGWTDIMVCAPRHPLSNGAPEGGALFIYFGGPVYDGAADKELQGECGYDWFG